MWKRLKSILVALFLWFLVGIAMYLFFSTPPGIRDEITAVCFVLVVGGLYNGNRTFIKITSELNDRIYALEQILAHLEAKKD